MSGWTRAAAQRDAALLASGELLDARIPGGRRSARRAANLELRLEGAGIRRARASRDVPARRELVEVRVGLPHRPHKLVEAFLRREDFAQAFLDRFAHAVPGSSCGSCGSSRCGCPASLRFALDVLSSPAMMRSTVTCPRRSTPAGRSWRRDGTRARCSSDLRLANICPRGSWCRRTEPWGSGAATSDSKRKAARIQ